MTNSLEANPTIFVSPRTSQRDVPTKSFAGVMRRAWLRFGGFLSRFLIGLDPFGVKHARFVDTLVSVRAEEIALGLQQVRGQTRRAIAVEVGERRGKRWDRDTIFNGRTNGTAPLVLG